MPPQNTSVSDRPTGNSGWFDRAQECWKSPHFVWLILLLGIVVRLKYYLEFPGLWLDEVYLALNIRSRSLVELMKPLDYAQSAPYGFLAIEKLATMAFGDNEVALRLWPQLCGLTTLPLFYLLMRRWLSTTAQPVAMILMSCSDHLIHQSGLAKHYSSDVVFTTAILALASIAPSQLWIWTLSLCLLGVVAIWMSYPVIFVMAAVGLTLFTAACREKEWRRATALVIVGVSWLVSFAASYMLVIQPFRQSDTHQQLHNYWYLLGFPPQLSGSPGVIKWYFEWYFIRICHVFREPAGFHLPGISIVLFVLGCVYFSRTDKRRLSIVALTWGLAMVAASLHAYPFFLRLLQFGVPLIYLTVAAGVGLLLTKTFRPLPILGIVTIGLLLLGPVSDTIQHFAQRRITSSIKTALMHLASHWEDGDVVYLQETAHYGFMYYQDRLGLSDIEPLVGPATSPVVPLADRLDRSWIVHLSELDRARGARRVWVLFDAPYYQGTVDLYLPYLEQHGIKLEELKLPETELYLFDLSKLQSFRADAGQDQACAQLKPLVDNPLRSDPIACGADNGTAALTRDLRIPGFRWAPGFFRRAVVNRP